jgi:hypothetical protein
VLAKTMNLIYQAGIASNAVRERLFTCPPFDATFDGVCPLAERARIAIFRVTEPSIMWQPQFDARQLAGPASIRLHLTKSGI